MNRQNLIIQIQGGILNLDDETLIVIADLIQTIQKTKASINQQHSLDDSQYVRNVIDKVTNELQHQTSSIEQKNASIFSAFQNISTQLQSLANLNQNQQDKIDKLLFTSQRKGECFQNVIFNQLITQYPNCIINNTSKTNESGDLQVFFPEECVMLLELKNYSQTVGTQEVNKFIRDVDCQQVDCGLFLVKGVAISGKKQVQWDKSPNGKPLLYISRYSCEVQDVLSLSIQSLKEFTKQTNEYKSQHQQFELFQSKSNSIQNALNLQYTYLQKQKRGFESQLKEVNIQLTLTEETIKGLKQTHNTSTNQKEIPNIQEPVNSRKKKQQTGKPQKTDTSDCQMMCDM